MASAHDRITALETELAELKASIRAPEPSPVVDAPEGVTITVMPLVSSLEMPRPDQLEQLRTLVERSFPRLACDSAEFAAAFRAIGSFGRRDKLDTLHGVGWWIDHARDRLKQLDRPHRGDLGAAALTAAVLASGDVIYHLGNFPHETEFGLDPYGTGSRIASDAWRRVLETGTLPHPVAHETSNYPVPQVRITGGPIPLWTNTPDGRVPW